MDCRMTERLTSDILEFRKLLNKRNVALFHPSTQHPVTSLHVISFTRPSPALVLQMTNIGVRRPGYEVTIEGMTLPQLVNNP